MNMPQPQSPVTARRSLIAVIGDAQLDSGSPVETVVEDIGRALVDAGYRVLTGGLGGVMEAACRGARSSKKYQPGDTIAVLPGHDPREANPFVDVAIASGLDHGRNSVVAHADAIVAIGGGAGTLSEICFAWIYKRLIVGMRVEGWSGKLADQRVDNRVRYPEIPNDRVFGADNADQVVDLLRANLPIFVSQHHGVVRRST
jgi:uncharacterized protein (TIGR00725 family)